MNADTTTAAADAAALPPLGEGAATSAPDAPPLDASAGFRNLAHALWDDLRGALTERVELLTLEVRLAGLTLIQLVIYAVIVAVLVVTAWLGLMSGAVVAFMSWGLHWSMALGLGIAINLVVAAWLVRTMMRMIERVGLPASLRRVNQRPQADPGAAATPAATP